MAGWQYALKEGRSAMKYVQGAFARPDTGIALVSAEVALQDQQPLNNHAVIA